VRRGIVLTIAAAAACLLVSGCGSASKPTVPANGVALVGTDVITTAELTGFLQGAKAAAAAKGETVPKAGTTAYRTYREQAVAYLVDASMYEQEAIKMGIGVTPKQVAAAIATIRKQEFGGSETKLRASMQAAGVTESEFNREELLTLTEETLQNKLLTPVKVTESATKAYYTSHESSYRTKAGKLKPFTQVEASIHTKLLQAKGAAVIKAWEKRTTDSFCAGTVVYSPAYKPRTAADDPCAASATDTTTSTNS
jgi:parvulin-like peptidyl-prolyl isomerase